MQLHAIPNRHRPKITRQQFRNYTQQQSAALMNDAVDKENLNVTLLFD